MYILTSTLLALSLSTSSVLAGTYGWLAAYAPDDIHCKGGYFLGPDHNIGKYRPIVGSTSKAQIDWSPAALMGGDKNISQFGVNWGSGGIGFQHKRLAFYSDKGCISTWLGTIDRPPGKNYGAQHVSTCFSTSGFDGKGVYQDGRAIQCVRSDKSEGEPPKGDGIVRITDDCPNGC